MNILIFACAFLLIKKGNTFSIIRSLFEPHNARVGDKILLKCSSDVSWEFCNWRHIPTATVCQFKWKRKHSGVKKKTCDLGLGERAEYVGTYQSHECDLELFNVTLRDEGIWRCEMEERLMGGIKGGTDARNVTLTLVKEGGDQVKGVIKKEFRSPVINLNQTDQTLIQIDNRDNGMDVPTIVPNQTLASTTEPTPTTTTSSKVAIQRIDTISTNEELDQFSNRNLASTTEATPMTTTTSKVNDDTIPTNKELGPSSNQNLASTTEATPTTTASKVAAFHDDTTPINGELYASSNFDSQFGNISISDNDLDRENSRTSGITDDGQEFNPGYQVIKEVPDRKEAQTTEKTPDKMADPAGQKIYQVSETSEQVKTDGCLQNALIIGGGFTAIFIIVGLAIFLTRRHHQMHYEIKQAWLRRFNTSSEVAKDDSYVIYTKKDSRKHEHCCHEQSP